MNQVEIISMATESKTESDAFSVLQQDRKAMLVTKSFNHDTILTVQSDDSEMEVVLSAPSDMKVTPSTSGLDMLTMVATASEPTSTNLAFGSTKENRGKSLDSVPRPVRPTLPSIRSVHPQVDFGLIRRTDSNGKFLRQHPILSPILTKALTFSRALQLANSPPLLPIHAPRSLNSFRSYPSPNSSSPHRQQYGLKGSPHQQITFPFFLSPTLGSPSLSSSVSTSHPAFPISRCATQFTAQPSTPLSPIKVKREKSCGSCLAEYSSGNWYKDRSRPGEYICKSCYVCLNRKKKKLERVMGGVDCRPASTSSESQGAGVSLPYGRPRRRGTKRAGSVVEDRECVRCASKSSSGDWYRDKSGPNWLMCQKCYQRSNRDKVKKRAEDWIAAVLEKKILDPEESGDCLVGEDWKKSQGK